MVSEEQRNRKPANRRLYLDGAAFTDSSQRAEPLCRGGWDTGVPVDAIYKRHASQGLGGGRQRQDNASHTPQGLSR